MKKFLKNYDRQAAKDSQFMQQQTKCPQYDPDVGKINKEKLLICCKVVGSRLKDVMKKLDSKKGIAVDKGTMCKIKPEERAFLFRGPKAITQAYLKYVHKEDWFLKAQSKFPQFKKDKKISGKEDQKNAMWSSIQKVCTELLA